MPDIALMQQASLVAAVSAFGILFVLGWWGPPHSTRVGVACTVSLGIGFFLGCVVLGFWPNWPPLGDRDRYVLVLLPLSVVVESLAALKSMAGWLVWTLRSTLAAAVLPILLHGTIYLVDTAGPDTREWSLPVACAIASGLAVVVILTWWLLERLQVRTSERTLGAVVFLAAGATGLAIMLSGYTSGGQLGFPLAGALGGATAASLLGPKTTGPLRCNGVGVIGLFGMLVLGRFFGTLPTFMAFCLLLAPLAAWLPEAPWVCRLDLRLRTVFRFLAVGLVLLFVVVIAYLRFTAAAPGEIDY